MSQVVAIVFVMIAFRNTRVTRLLFSLVFIGASAVNLSTALTNPDAYLNYAKMALPFYRDFINGWFSHHHQTVVPVIAAGQLLVGVGMLLRGWRVQWACIGAIVFLLGITPLMVGSAFPFTLLVSWAALRVLQHDNKDWLWRPTATAATQKTALSSAAFLTWIAFMLTVVATTTGLFAGDIYRDNNFVKTAWQASDWVTLSAVVPALLLILLNRSKVVVQLLWAGVLGYLIYNYAFYLLGALFNENFLVYVGIVASATWAMVALLRRMPVQSLQLTTRYHRWVSGYLFFIALMLLAVEVAPTIHYGFTSALPDIVVKSNHPTSVVYALDLTMVVPTCIVAGYWLWTKKPWGVVLSAIMLVKAAAYGLVLCSGTILLMMRQVESDPLLPFYVFIMVGGIVGLFVLLGGVQQTDESEIFTRKSGNVTDPDERSLFWPV